MPGTGYNIPISVSASETLSIPTSYNAPNIITYGSGNLLTGDSSAQSNPVQPSTANSAAAEGNAATSSQSPTTATSTANGGSNTLLYIAAGGSLLAVVAVIFLLVKHKG